jgi:hypothetical protein
MRARVQGSAGVCGQLECPLHVGHCLELFPSLQIGPSPPVVGFGKFRVEIDRLAVVGDRTLEIALAPAGDAAIEVGSSVFRVQLDCLAAVGNGRIVVALPCEV